jgi:hypothetical protein
MKVLKYLSLRLQLDPSGCLRFIVCILLQLTEGQINLLSKDNWLKRQPSAELVNMGTQRPNCLKFRSKTVLRRRLSVLWLRANCRAIGWRDKLNNFEERKLLRLNFCYAYNFSEPITLTFSNLCPLGLCGFRLQPELICCVPKIKKRHCQIVRTSYFMQKLSGSLGNWYF